MPIPHPLLHRLLRAWLLLVLTLGYGLGAWAQGVTEDDVALTARYWVDTSGTATIDDATQIPAEQLLPLDRHHTFTLGDGALWMRLELPATDPTHHWFLVLDGSAFTDHAGFYQFEADVGWKAQQAGDHLPVAQWSIPARSPEFAVDHSTAPRTVWLRLDNKPAPMSPRVYLISAEELQQQRAWTYLLVGGYLGFGLLVLFLGWVHVRLYADRAFVAYVLYVTCMLGFQTAFTGLGGLFFWPHWAGWNNAAPSVFMLWLTASGIWFVREVCAVRRHHRGLDRFMWGWSVFGLLYPAVYLGFANAIVLAGLNLYGLLSVIMSFAVCVWTWRRGERYAGWIALGFLPVHLSYPFPALRAAGLVPDSWLTQYAVLIGSAIEIPVLLYILHRRVRDFSENRARLRALDSTDPLTGLTIKPVLTLRLQDSVRRARRYGHHCGLLLVELANHPDIRMRLGREAGDRSLVVAAARLTRVMRDVDTVCRVTDTRFAILVEGPVQQEQIKLLAQHVVAKGLEPASILPEDMSLRFRLVSTLLPGDQALGQEEDEREEIRRCMDRLHRALDELGSEARKPVLHLPRVPAPPTTLDATG